MTLTEFLLARIAEDERAVGAIDFPDWPASLAIERDGDHPNTVFVESGRMLAECEAKRRIVGCFDEDRPAYAQILELLALPYANHPDYDEAWRP